MFEFIDVLIHQSFMQNAIVIGLLASVACGVMGTYVVVRRIVFISGGIAHAVLGGMGIAYYYGYNPIHGAVLSALIAALIIGFVSLQYQQYEDTLIGALWAVGMAVGILFIYKTPGYNVDLMSYLFGNILMVQTESVHLLAYLDGLIILSVMASMAQELHKNCPSGNSTFLHLRHFGIFIPPKKGWWIIPPSPIFLVPFSVLWNNPHQLNPTYP